MGQDFTKLIVHKIDDNKTSLEKFEKEIEKGSSEDSELILEFPTVYIHTWPETNTFAIYVGEANHIIQRTLQHYSKSDNQRPWEKKLQQHKNTAELYVIAHSYFNKSLTLDLENRLMHYLTGVENIRILNKRGNPQTKYFPVEEFDNIFKQVWDELNKRNPKIFPEESVVKNSVLFKASPFHKLIKDQEDAQITILEKISSALKKNKTHQLIFVEGEAGTGKTVLSSSTFYELYAIANKESDNGYEKNIHPNYHMIVNHNEQLTVYNQIMLKLGLQHKNGEIVWKATTFINKHNLDEPVDVAFVDEAHLLLTQHTQGYHGNGENQLQDIIDRARVTVIMFDENQILTTEQYWEHKILETYRKRSQKLDNYIELTNQLRIKASTEVLQWIDSITKNQSIEKLSSNRGGYDIRVFTNIEDMDNAITEKASEDEYKLSRLIATYDWDYNGSHSPENSDFWKVKIGSWSKPWNYQYQPPSGTKQDTDLAWAEQKETINEVGSTFTIQGFDLNYAGVILGPSVTYQDGKIIFDPSKHHYEKATRNRTLSNGTKQSFGEMLIQHEVRILMTRGVNGLYIYACDPALREKLLESIPN